MQRTAAIEAYWAGLREAAGLDHDRASKLIDLMLAGGKRATASLARDFGGEEPLPKSGDHVVVIEVDDAFAWDEGEGDRSRAFWLDAHRRYFARQAACEGFAMHDLMPTVFERFMLVWPPEAADRFRTAAAAARAGAPRGRAASGQSRAARTVC
jgi:uncharacterized protein YhfF